MYVRPTHWDWEERLPLMKLTINNAFQESIQNTPLYLNRLRHPRMPYGIPRRSSVPAVHKFHAAMKQAVDEAKRCILLAQERQKKYADMHRSKVHFAVGEAVWLSTTHIRLHAVGARKLYPRWVGPFLVERRLGTLNYELDLPPNMTMHPVFHVSLLKRYYTNGVMGPPPPPIVIDGEEENEVEEILTHKPQTGRPKEYLIKWVGYGPEHNLWIPASDKQNSQEMVEEYKKRIHAAW